jgi:hypothetical protein
MKGITKYDGKQAPQQWLRCYSKTTKVIYFPMALEAAPLSWLESLRKDSINSWDDLKAVITDNFQGAITRAGTHHDLSQYKQERKELLRSYTRRFFNTRAAIANISEQDIIDCFNNSITDQTLVRNFGRNRPKTVAGLCDMLQAWADPEEQERDRFSRRGNNYNNNNKRGNDHRSDRSQWDHSGSSQKSNPDDLVATIQRPPRGKKSGTT